MCRAHCMTSFLTTEMTDTGCVQSTQCTSCWINCEHLVNEPYDRDEICDPRHGEFCLDGCQSACDFALHNDPGSQGQVISPLYKQWSFWSMPSVEVVTSEVLLLSWTRPVPKISAVIASTPGGEDAVIIYVIMLKSSRAASWRHLYCTTEHLVALEVNHNVQDDLYYRILAVTREGLLATMDHTVQQEHLKPKEKQTELSLLWSTTFAPTMSTEQVVIDEYQNRVITENPKLQIDASNPSTSVYKIKKGMSSLQYHLALVGCLIPPVFLSLLAIILYARKEKKIYRIQRGSPDSVKVRRSPEETRAGGTYIFNPRDPLLRTKMIAARTDMALQGRQQDCNIENEVTEETQSALNPRRHYRKLSLNNSPDEREQVGIDSTEDRVICLGNLSTIEEDEENSET